MQTDLSHLKLGEKTPLPKSPAEAQLDVVPNPGAAIAAYCARFTIPEFTSLCPVTSQPDYAHIIIDYVPNEWLVESKALKLFMGSFRNEGSFHEACTMEIVKRFGNAAKPRWYRVVALWFPRGGIPIDVFYQMGDPPEGLFIPPLPDLQYRGR